jgi:GTPase Era involved in 16S rRNA processing
LPFVFLLGNHSSGKSSFINYVCQRKVQTAGVAPTDDSFTIIVPGPADVDRDGPTFIGDPELGFSGLRTFGPPLVHHSKLKIRSNIAIKNFMIVDTPGMIDSPMVRDAVTGTNKYAVMDRGYDFEGVCRWYAERADVILLFFDPDKPGTTGETLSILTNSLVGLDHKLHIILNKADQFRKIHDFARAYGSLCWNLSKVIQRKDLPMIHTMCLPQNYQSHQQVQSMGNGADTADSSIAQGLADLELTREDVVQEVLNAPKRRVDNEISRLTDSVSLLQMHINIVDELSKQYKSAVFRSRMTLGLTGTTSVGILVALVLLGMPPEIIAGATAISGVGSGGLFWWQSKDLRRQSGQLATENAMNAAFQKLYARRIAEKDEFTISLWHRVQDHLTLTLSSEDLAGLEKVTAAHVAELDRVLEVEIPNLRRKAAPAFNRK